MKSRHDAQLGILPSFGPPRPSAKTPVKRIRLANGEEVIQGWLMETAQSGGLKLKEQKAPLSTSPDQGTYTGPPSELCGSDHIAVRDELGHIRCQRCGTHLEWSSLRK